MVGSTNGSDRTPPTAGLASSGPAREPLLSVRDLSISYGAAPAVSGISFSIEAGKALALLGPNGAGKSSVARALSGLLTGRVSGSVQLSGIELLTQRPHKTARRGVAFVPEDRGIFRGLSVQDNLRMASRNGVVRRERQKHVDRVFALFPILGERKSQLAGTLSGGEQQMLALGRVLAGDAKVLIIDEPSLGLSPMAIDRVYEAMAQLRQSGLTFLLIEQFVDRALGFCEEVMLLRRGSVVVAGPTATVRDSILQEYLPASGR